MRILLAALVAVVSFPALAQTHQHPPQDAEAHNRFYAGWMKPDNPTVSCCSDRDCYPVEARMVDGHWRARRREDGVWLRVPPEKVEVNRDNPDGRNHMCAPPPGRGDVPFCFIPGAGG